MGSAFNSIDDLLASVATNGPVVRNFFQRSTAAITAANTTSGYVTTRRQLSTITVPSLGAGLTGLIFTTIRMAPGGSNSYAISCAALEYELGVLTVSGNSFAAGAVASMPTKTIRGTSIQTASLLPVVVATTALGGATTPALTITYTDQDGNASQTASLTLPTNPTINSGFLVTPHLASGDTGWRDVTNMSISAGTSGTLKAYGLLPLAFDLSAGTGANAGMALDLIPSNLPAFVAETNDIIAFYMFGSTAATDFVAFLFGVADN